MDFDISKLGTGVSLSSLSWLEPHERQAAEVLSKKDRDMYADVLDEPSVNLKRLSGQYIQDLPGTVRQAVQERLRQIDQVMDAGPQTAGLAAAEL